MKGNLADQKLKRILAIETSCDETAVAFLSSENDVYTVVGQELYSQIDMHKPFGGVFPMLAKREHGKNLIYLTEQLFQKTDVPSSSTSFSISEESKSAALSYLNREPELLGIFKTHFDNPEAFFYKRPDVEAMAVTVGPGLEPALWVGISFAKALATLWNIPILPINHMEGHIASVAVDAPANTETFPALALLISGGHTEIVHATQWGQYSVIGNTKDDAIGEAYDKVARILGLDYPGGPEISKHGSIIRGTYSTEDAEKLCREHGIKLPRPMIKSKDTHFSFSGLKTAVLYLVRDLKTVTEEQAHLICFEFEQAVTEVLVSKLETALKQSGEIKSLIVGGGVIANTYIRDVLQAWSDTHSITFFKPSPALATDNAIMIGVAALIQLNHGYVKLVQPLAEELEKVTARGGWRIDEI